MKKLCTFLLLAATFITIRAQQGGKWIPQGENLLPNNNYSTQDIAAVDESIVWALLHGEGVEEPLNDLSSIIIRSTDGGESWDVLSIDTLADGYAVSLSAVSDTTAWLSMDDDRNKRRLIYKTDDGGKSWKEQYNIAARDSNYVYAPVVKFKNEEEGYFIDVYGSNAGLTTDGGATWTTNAFQPSTLDGYFGVLAPENWWDVKGDTIWWGTSRSISRSTDGSKSWNKVNINLPQNNTIQSIKFNKQGLGLAISDVQTVNNYTAIEETVVLRSTDFGATWNRLPNVPFPMSIITYIPGTENSFIGISGKWFAFGEQIEKYTSAFTDDGGNTWKLIDNGIARNAIDFVSPTVGWAGRVANFNYGASNPIIFKWEGSLSTSTKDIKR